MTGGRPGVFLDRDGTIIEDVSYIARPEDVKLIPGVADAIARLNNAGHPVIVISNQSGIGRGFYSLKDFELVQAQMLDLLARNDAHIDGVYICPHVPERECECRKPGTLLYRRAIEEHGLDPANSWYVGDRWRDLAAAEMLGGNGILVPSLQTSEDEREIAAQRATLMTSLGEAVEHILAAA
ncbi:MAG: D-glycero-alpha-D-manno-heptose-1,7-bisphosphate 7-phosphatase [Gemmatimonadaceae bacterium]